VSPAPHSPAGLPVIDIAALLDDGATAEDVAEVSSLIDAACRQVGFFGIVGHGIDRGLQQRLERASHEFFQRPESEKAKIAMDRAGAAWRGWFPVGGELTSGRPDRKEGIYFGTEHPTDHPDVLASTPLHGTNQFPTDPATLRDAVLDWLDAVRPVADAVMRGISLGLGLPAPWFEQHLTADPTILFRIFHYPAENPVDGEQWGVGEHTDYGLLTLLAQDDLGGLEVRDLHGRWTSVDADRGVIVCNIGDMLERLTGGRYRSTPHRVRNVSTTGRLSFPYFFDPSWDATVPTLPLDGSPLPDRDRWDGGDVTAWDGTYGDYLVAKVSNVFPGLFAELPGQPAAPPSAEPQ
jgi:isopenicillin N synthase-like dioxygenase